MLIPALSNNTVLSQLIIPVKRLYHLTFTVIRLRPLSSYILTGLGNETSFVSES